MALSGTRLFKMTMYDIADAALKKIGGNVLKTSEFNDAMQALNLIMSDLQNQGQQLWTRQYDLIPLVSGIAQYTIDVAAIEADTFFFRRDGSDTYMDSYTREDYARISSKGASGDPNRYYIDWQLSAPIVTIYPVYNAPLTVTGYTSMWSVYGEDDLSDNSNATTGLWVDDGSGSMTPSGTGNDTYWQIDDAGDLMPRQAALSTGFVVGRDSKSYICTTTHISDSTNEPGAGADWTGYWEECTFKTAVDVWSDSITYDSGHIRFTKILRSQDLDTSSQDPDAPVRWQNALVWLLADALSPNYGLQRWERQDLKERSIVALMSAKAGNRESVNLRIYPRIGE